jgi:arylsulfatase A-like enzyme/catechol 2,3-dioxygenase-like lactoylglutathione lyase family enzyme
MSHRSASHAPGCIHAGWALLVIGLLSASRPCRAEEPSAAPKPNIVIFLADDLGYADLGVQGCRDIPTPHIDSIARGGVRFTDGYANHPVCSPSRAALMSGRYQHRFGFEHNSGPERYAAENFGLPRDEPTIAERLKPLGYATGMVGKWHIGFKEGLRPHERGFDFHYGFLSGAHTYLPDGRDADPIVRNGTPVTDEKEYLTDAFAREAVSFIDRSKEGPFFLYVAFNAVHSPQEATSKYEQRFASITDPKRRTYAGMLSAMDDAVGRVLAKLKEIGQDENTLIFFYSDNGGPTPQTTSRNDPLRGFKGQVLEGGIRVPFLAQWKGRLPEGKVYDQPVMAFDIHATALAAAGGTLPAEKPLDGVDLLPFLTGQKSGAPHDRLFWRAGAQSAVRMGDWKLVSARGEAPQLFNLRDDIGESKDRSKTEPAKFAELRGAYQAWDTQMMPAQWVRQDARTTRRPAAGPAAPAGADPFRERDRDGDGKLTREELGFPRLFDRLDTDKDGFLTRKEAEPVLQRFGQRARPRPEPENKTSRPPGEAAPQAANGPSRVPLAEVDYRVRDVEAAVKFYRDGVGMKLVEEDATQGEALLELFGTGLRLRMAEGEDEPRPAAAAGRGPMMQLLAANGFRYPSLWFAEPEAVCDRIEKAGFARPRKYGNVWLTQDSQGQVIELMQPPANLPGERFTLGVVASDLAAARTFYADKLGFVERATWKLPAPVNADMVLLESGPFLLKITAPPGERPDGARRGLSAPGFRSLTLRRADLAPLGDPGSGSPKGGPLELADPDGNRIVLVQAAGSAVGPPAGQPSATGGQRPVAGGALRSAIEQRYRQLDKDGDGKLSAEEGKPIGALFGQADTDRDGFLTPAEATRYFQNPANRLRPGNLPPVDLDSVPPTPIPAPEKPGEPSLKPLLDSDAVRDAAGRGQIFESIHVEGLTTIREGMNGLAIADLNRDGRLDIVATFSPPRGQGAGTFGRGEKLRVLINEGGFRYREHAITLRDSKLTLDDFGRGQVPNLADFNGDGFLDIFVTRHAPMTAGANRRGIESPGNSLLLSDGAWDRFRDVSDAMGIRNEQAYNRQPSIGDVNRDGWLDISIGCDNIKNAMGGVPHSRLYVFRPKGSRFEDGRFEDIGGTELVPDFGGFYHDSARDKAGPDINLRDLDNDGDLDLIQTCHVDVREPLLPYWPGEYRQGVFCWKNLLAETGELRFEKVTGNGLAAEARLRYDRQKQVFEPEGRAPGLPYCSLADVDHDGLLDILCVGPANPGWAPRADYVAGRFWRNLGGFWFQEATDEVDLGPLNWTLRQRAEFFDMPLPPRLRNWQPGRVGNYESQPGRPRTHPLDGWPYFADAIFGDFDNDGWQDVVVQDRSEGEEPARATLFLGREGGRFEVTRTQFSGLDSNGICGEAADLNGDGLLDLVFAADPDNSGLATDPRRYESRVYWNTGEHGARANHWLRLRFTGVKDAELIGARVEVLEPGTGKRLGTRVVAANHSYKSGGALEVHFGLGIQNAADLKITLPSGKTVSLPGVKSDQFLDVDLNTSQTEQVHP